MIKLPKVSALIVLLIVVFSSAYALVNTVRFANIEPQQTAVTETPTDTTSDFKIKKYKQDTYDDLNTVYPMDNSVPSNIKLLQNMMLKL
jgi:hypothetical protein